MTRSKLPLLLALVALGFAAYGCCGACDAIQSPETRQKMVSDYNSKPATGCKLSGSGDYTELTMTCKKKDVRLLKAEGKATCSTYKMLGIEKVSYKGKNGKVICTLSDCTCKKKKK